MKKGKTAKIKAGIIKKAKDKKRLSFISVLRFTSTDTKVATVTGKGRIKAKGKGTCHIYVIALNGVRKKIKVIVK